MTETAYFYSQGLITPDTSATLAEVQSEYLTAFGSDLVLDPSTPQGVLISAETLARNNFINNNAAIANQINPNYAGGVLFDAIWALTGGQRTLTTPTVVSGVTVTGVSGTTIPVGSQAATAAGDLFQTTQTVIIPSGGTTTVNFQSVQSGAIPCAANALTTVVSAVLGWETVNNSVAGVVGTVTESDQAARGARNNTLAFQSKSLPGAAISALYNVPGVTSVFFQENVAATTATINGITMGSHSVYACIAGGVETAIAAALLENKSSGAGWNGGTTVDLVEPASGQTYAVQFDIAEQIGILIQATVHGASTSQVQQAILNYAAGTVTDPAGNAANFPGFQIGGNVSPYEIAAAISVENPSCYVSLIQLSYLSPISYVTTPLTIDVNQIAYTQLSYISVNIV